MLSLHMNQLVKSMENWDMCNDNYDDRRCIIEEFPQFPGSRRTGSIVQVNDPVLCADFTFLIKLYFLI